MFVLNNHVSNNKIEDEYRQMLLNLEGTKVKTEAKQKLAGTGTL